MPRRIAILGSTGSIGVNALKVASSLGKEVEIIALSADSNIKVLARQVNIFNPKVICVRDGSYAQKIKKIIPSCVKVLCGNDGLEEIASRADIDTVLFAISGLSCTKPLIKAIESKKKIALANKEALVSAGSIIMRLAKENGVNIIPIDSEHSAIFQCLEGKREYLKKLYLTATGGPLRDIPKSRFDRLSPNFILNHPKWKMGKKISVDSATMMNKGLEIIEAKWLFDVDAGDIEVVVHPEAIIHSMISLIDGTFFAQLSVPDMRLPIQYAITYPVRFDTKLRSLNFSQIRSLSLERPDTKKFPCLNLAQRALEMAGVYPALLNAANEEAVKKYLECKIKFSRIPYIIEKVLAGYTGSKIKELSLNEIIGAECWAREEALRLCH
ncbi:MAG: 1-deoxy-D-xylulose-5-phosphate reductoisomerase [Candidatus Omnitrophota bacterium]|nr:1-deoxy-D-xylulose-5-phosphate reductoisomerase [Candidatus Omnitrophota bacterium]